MRSKELSNLETADLCRELALLLHSGVSAADALYLMAEEEKATELQELAASMASAMDSGCSLYQAFERAGCFPIYMIELIHVGETVGRAEESLNSLADYFERRERMKRQIVSSLSYPAILLLLMLIVIVVLLSKVLPVFNEIYMSLGTQLSGLAGGLLLLGNILSRAMPVLCAILILVVLGAALLYMCKGLRGRILNIWQHKFGDRRISRMMNNARFAQAMSMAFSSGMLPEAAVEMAAALLADCPAAASRCTRCRDALAEGAELSTALESAGLLGGSSCRLLTLAMRSGSGDSIMEKIARRMEDEASQTLERTVGKIEPALVLVTSALVGIILLSVMLPLMNIMTAIG